MPAVREVAAAALATACAAGALAAPARSAVEVPPAQALVTLLDDRAVRTGPHADARRIETVRARRPLTRVLTVLPVLDRATSETGTAWLRVRLPGRPNGHEGWILAARTRPAATPWHLALSLSTRRLAVYRHGRVVRRFSAVIGRPSTPTPTGDFFVEEALAFAPGTPGGPFALATSARSNVLQQYAGGPGQIALHGTQGLSAELGTSASHGCIRLSTAAITWLAGRVGGGVPLTVRR
ncbi:MAG TPA: L,D-transpeptidase [Thermoleophilaceae bacterium]|jgi:hypothetical protein